MYDYVVALWASLQKNKWVVTLVSNKWVVALVSLDK